MLNNPNGARSAMRCSRRSERRCSKCDGARASVAMSCNLGPGGRVDGAVSYADTPGMVVSTRGLKLIAIAPNRPGRVASAESVTREAKA